MSHCVKVSSSFNCVTFIADGVVNYFHRLWGMGIPDAICRALKCAKDTGHKKNMSQFSVEQGSHFITLKCPCSNVDILTIGLFMRRYMKSQLYLMMLTPFLNPYWTHRLDLNRLAHFASCSIRLMFWWGIFIKLCIWFGHLYRYLTQL